MKANAVHVVELGKVGVLPIEVPDPKYDEVMVRTKACGLCCWDSWLIRGVNAPGPYAVSQSATKAPELWRKWARA